MGLRTLARALLFAGLAVTIGCGGLLGLSDDDEDDGDVRPTADASDADVSSAAGDSAGGEVGPSGPCGDFLFCDDFERPDLVGPWDGVGTYGAGTSIAIDSSRAASPSRSLRVVASSAGEGGHYLRRALPTTAKRVDVAFSMSLDALPKDDIQVITVSFDDQSWVYFIVDENGAVILEQVTGNGQLPIASMRAASPSFGGFERRTFILDVTDKYIEIVGPAGATRHTLRLQHGNVSELRVGSGFAYAAPGELWIDDVAARWE